MDRMGAFIALALILLMAAPQASAGRGLPTAALRSEERLLQRPSGGSFCWTENMGVGCGDWGWEWPDARRVVAGRELRMRVRAPRAPDGFYAVAYRQIDLDGVPRGEGRPLDLTVSPVVDENGKVVAWDHAFVTAANPRRYYVIVYSRWAQTDDPAEGYGDRTWFFYVKTMEPD